jgi:hypothetical protein
MNQVNARHEIIREWRSLPKELRQTDEQAAAFAMQIKDKYKFSSDRADPYQIVKGWLLCLSLTRSCLAFTWFIPLLRLQDLVPGPAAIQAQSSGTGKAIARQAHRAPSCRQQAAAHLIPNPSRSPGTVRA